MWLMVHAVVYGAVRLLMFLRNHAINSDSETSVFFMHLYRIGYEESESAIGFQIFQLFLGQN